MPQLFINLSDGTMVVQELAGIVTVGRNPANLLTVDEPSVSSQHAKIDIGANGVYITDLFSSNGTFVNGERIMTSRLEHGDKVRLGKVECVFSTENGG